MEDSSRGGGVLLGSAGRNLQNSETSLPGDRRHLRATLEALSRASLQRSVDPRSFVSAFRLVAETLPAPFFSQQNAAPDPDGGVSAESDSPAAETAEQQHPFSGFHASSAPGFGDSPGEGARLVGNSLRCGRVAVGYKVLKAFAPFSQSLETLQKEAAALSQLCSRARRQLEGSRALLSSSELSRLPSLHSRRVRVEAEFSLCALLWQRLGPPQGLVALAVQGGESAPPLSVSFFEALDQLAVRMRRLRRAQRVLATQGGLHDGAAPDGEGSAPLVEDLLKQGAVFQELVFERLFVAALAGVRGVAALSAQSDDDEAAATAEAFFEKIAADSETLGDNEEAPCSTGLHQTSSAEAAAAPSQEELLWMAVVRLQKIPSFFVQCVSQLLKARRQLLLRKIRKAGKALQVLVDVDALRSAQILAALVEEAVAEERAFSNSLLKRLQIRRRRTPSAASESAGESADSSTTETEEGGEEGATPEEERREFSWKNVQLSGGPGGFAAEPISSWELKRQLLTREALEEAVLEVLEGSLNSHVQRACEAASARSSSEVLRLALFLASESARLEAKLRGRGSACTSDEETPSRRQPPPSPVACLENLASFAYDVFMKKWSSESLRLPPQQLSTESLRAGGVHSGSLSGFLSKFCADLEEVVRLHEAAAECEAFVLERRASLWGEGKLGALVESALAPVLNHCRQAAAFMAPAEEGIVFQINEIHRLRQALLRGGEKGAGAAGRAPRLLPQATTDLLSQLLNEQIQELATLEAARAQEALGLAFLEEALNALGDENDVNAAADAQEKSAASTGVASLIPREVALARLSPSSLSFFFDKFWSQVYAEKTALKLPLISAVADAETQREARRQALTLLFQSFAKVHAFAKQVGAAPVDAQTPESLKALLDF